MDESAVLTESPEPPAGDGQWDRIRRYAAERIIRPGLARAPYDKAILLACVSLASGCVALLLHGVPLFGTELITGTGGRRLSRAGTVALFVTLATALWALGIASIAARRARWWLVAVAVTSAAVVGCLHVRILRLAQMVSRILTPFPSVDFGIVTVPSWALYAAAISMLAPAAVLLVPLRRLTAHPVRYAMVVSVPVWSALLLWAGLSHDPNPLPSILHVGAEATEQLTAPPSAVSLDLLSNFLYISLLGGLGLFALIAAPEVADANVTTARAAARWRPAHAHGLLVALVLGKAVFLGFGFAGTFGHGGGNLTWDHGVWAQWVIVAVLVLAAGLVYGRARVRPLVSGHLGPVTVLLVVGFGLPSLVILALPYFQSVATTLLPGLWQDPVTSHVQDAIPHLIRFSPLATVVATGTVGAVLLARGARTDGAILAASSCLVGLPFGVQLALWDAGERAGRALVSVTLLDTAVTVAVVVVLVYGAVRRRTPQSHDLLVVLLASTLLAFSLEGFIPETVQSQLFAYVLLLPVVWRFAVDTRDEQRRPVGRVVLSMAAWSILLAVSALALAAGFDQAQWNTEQRPQWRLIAVPLAFVLLCWRLPAPPRPSPGWRAAPPPGDDRTEPVRVYVLGALVGLVLVGATAHALVRSGAVPQVERGRYHVSTPLPAGWLPVGCPSAPDAEVMALVLPVAKVVPLRDSAYVFAGNGRTEALRTQLERCPVINARVKDVWTDPGCTGAASKELRAAEVAEMKGGEYRMGSGVVQCVRWNVGSSDRFIVAFDSEAPDSGMRPEVVEVMRGITFEGRR
ncbi:hypothetical protein OG851_42740 (plasmid) [Streptomyces sp. NBC_00161]|uniref:hypothetical protein n=1 Tax=Streptomyces sp. NBC_00161 TaxID=2975671 RepID=UPI003250D51B